MKRGLLIVFTGNGKGKTTAAFGLALRALGHGLRVGVIQFIKGSWKSGEITAAARFKAELDCHVLGRGFTWKSANRAEDVRTARQAWDYARQTIRAGRHSVVILDELTYLIRYKMVPLAEILATLKARPPGMHIVVTGRHAPRALCSAADIVTEMRAVKHAYRQGIPAQPGIEY
jgi:cob(I)alamin adenosyltransferase